MLFNELMVNLPVQMREALDEGTMYNKDIIEQTLRAIDTHTDFSVQARDNDEIRKGLEHIALICYKTLYKFNDRRYEDDIMVIKLIEEIEEFNTEFDIKISDVDAKDIHKQIVKYLTFEIVDAFSLETIKARLEGMVATKQVKGVNRLIEYMDNVDISQLSELEDIVPDLAYEFTELMYDVILDNYKGDPDIDPNGSTDQRELRYR